MGKRSKAKLRKKLAKLERKAWTREGLERAGRSATLAEAPDATRDGAIPATELAARLAGSSMVLERNLARLHDDDGLTRARLSALTMLVLGGPRRLGSLADAEGVRPPTMTRLIHAMQADGLVERRPDPTDGRSVIIAATPTGERLLEAGRARQIAPLAEAIARLRPEDAALLARSSDILARLLMDIERPTHRR